MVVPVSTKTKKAMPLPDRQRSSVRKEGGLTALSFFSGAMGMDIGLESEGIEVLLASEINKPARQTITTNKPDIAMIGDIEEYDASTIRKFAGLSTKDEIDLIVGGPPCQAFSTAGKREGFGDTRGNVFLTFIDRIVNLRPRFAVIENVRGLLSTPLGTLPADLVSDDYIPQFSQQKGSALRFITTRLANAGYGVSFNLYNAANFGSPQKRERVVLICSRDGEKLPYLTPTHSETPSFGLPPWRTVREVFGGLSSVNHHFVKFPEKRLKYYRMLTAGQCWKNLPAELQQEALGASFFCGGGKTGMLRRIPWDAPSPTLVTHPAMPATDLAHPVEDRPLSVEEYKRIQEFPDNWVIEGKIVDQYRQIGNAVPVSLGRAIARHIKAHINGSPIVSIPDFPYSRYHKTSDRTWSVESLKTTKAK